MVKLLRHKIHAKKCAWEFYDKLSCHANLFFYANFNTRQNETADDNYEFPWYIRYIFCKELNQIST